MDFDHILTHMMNSIEPKRKTIPKKKKKTAEFSKEHEIRVKIL